MSKEVGYRLTRSSEALQGIMSSLYSFKKGLRKIREDVEYFEYNNLVFFVEIFQDGTRIADKVNNYQSTIKLQKGLIVEMRQEMKYTRDGLSQAANDLHSSQNTMKHLASNLMEVLKSETWGKKGNDRILKIQELEQIHLNMQNQYEEQVEKLMNLHSCEIEQKNQEIKGLLMDFQCEKEQIHTDHQRNFNIFMRELGKIRESTFDSQRALTSVLEQSIDDRQNDAKFQVKILGKDKLQRKFNRKKLKNLKNLVAQAKEQLNRVKTNTLEDIQCITEMTDTNVSELKTLFLHILGTPKGKQTKPLRTASLLKDSHSSLKDLVASNLSRSEYGLIESYSENWSKPKIDSLHNFLEEKSKETFNMSNKFTTEHLIAIENSFESTSFNPEEIQPFHTNRQSAQYIYIDDDTTEFNPIKTSVQSDSKEKYETHAESTHPILLDKIIPTKKTVKLDSFRGKLVGLLKSIKGIKSATTMLACKAKEEFCAMVSSFKSECEKILIQQCNVPLNRHNSSYSDQSEEQQISQSSNWDFEATQIKDHLYEFRKRIRNRVFSRTKHENRDFEFIEKDVQTMKIELTDSLLEVNRVIKTLNLVKLTNKRSNRKILVSFFSLWKENLTTPILQKYYEAHGPQYQSAPKDKVIKTIEDLLDRKHALDKKCRLYQRKMVGIPEFILQEITESFRDKAKQSEFLGKLINGVKSLSRNSEVHGLVYSALLGIVNPIDPGFSSYILRVRGIFQLLKSPVSIVTVIEQIYNLHSKNRKLGKHIIKELNPPCFSTNQWIVFLIYHKLVENGILVTQAFDIISQGTTTPIRLDKFVFSLQSKFELLIPKRSLMNLFISTGRQSISKHEFSELLNHSIYFEYSRGLHIDQISFIHSIIKSYSNINFLQSQKLLSFYQKNYPYSPALTFQEFMALTRKLDSGVAEDRIQLLFQKNSKKLGISPKAFAKTIINSNIGPYGVQQLI